jgi:hypothetical protein
MPRTVFVLAVALVASAARTVHLTPAAARVPSLVRCAPSDGGAGVAIVGEGGVTVGDGDGDLLTIPAGGAAPGTRVTLRRVPGSPYRRVIAQANAPVSGATLGIELTGCESAASYTVAYLPASGPAEDVHGVQNGTRITTPALPHLSIYAVATN